MPSLRDAVAAAIRELAKKRPKEDGRSVQAISRRAFLGRDDGYLGRKLNDGPLQLDELEAVLGVLGVAAETFFVEHVYSLRRDVEPVMNDYARTGGRFEDRLDALESRVSELEGK